MSASADISVLTGAIPERLGLLAECAASIRTQYVPPAEHLVHIDYEHAGVISTVNKLLSAASCEWIAQLADDDIAYPHHLGALLEAAIAGADIVYSWCHTVGRDWNPNEPYRESELRKHNIIPGSPLIRRSLAVELGGWRDTSPAHETDWDFYLRALDAGAKIVCVEDITWAFRFLGQNFSLSTR